MNRRMPTIASLCIGLFLSTTRAQSDALDHWVWRNPVPCANSLRSVCFGGGQFVAVGEGGYIYVSEDGLSWDSGRRPVSANLNRVIYANGQYVAVGDSGLILTSTDGQNWAQQSSGTSDQLLAVAYGNGRFVACGAAGHLAISTNSTDWNATSVGGTNLSWICFGNGVFVMAPITSTGYDLNSSVRVSADGQSWSTQTMPLPPNCSLGHIHDVCFGNGVLIASVQFEKHIPYSPSAPARSYFTSSDGTNWVVAGSFLLTTLPGNWWKVYYWEGSCTFAGGRFFEMLHNPDSLAANEVLFAAASAQELVPQVAPPPGGFNASGLAYGNGRYVMVGPNGNLWIATNGTNWSAGTTDRSFIRQVIRGANHYIAAGAGILVSPDGSRFSRASGSPSGWVGAVGFDGSNHVAVGQAGGVWSSASGTDWAVRTSNTGSDLAAICRGPTRWIAVGSTGTIITSPSGLAWTKRTSGTENDLFGVAFGNDTYVAVGNAGTILTSLDGTAWDVQFSGTLNHLYRVQFLNGEFFAVGASGTIVTSTNAVDWQPRTSGTTNAIYWITYGDGRYLAAGFKGAILTEYAPSAGFLLQSTNGVNWQDVTARLPTSRGLGCVAYLGRSFWLTGDFGTMLQSAPTSGGPQLTGGMLPASAGFRLSLFGVPGTTYRVQICTNLGAGPWYDGGTVTNLGAVTTWSDTNTADAALRFYRAVSP